MFRNVPDELLIVSSVLLNFILHDRRTGPVWNIIVWTALFLGLAVLVCLYSQEWYAQKYCPLQEVNTTTPCTVSHKHGYLILNSIIFIVEEENIIRICYYNNNNI